MNAPTIVEVSILILWIRVFHREGCREGATDSRADGGQQDHRGPQQQD